MRGATCAAIGCRAARCCYANTRCAAVTWYRIWCGCYRGGKCRWLCNCYGCGCRTAIGVSHRETVGACRVRGATRAAIWSRASRCRYANTRCATVTGDRIGSCCYRCCKRCRLCNCYRCSRRTTVSIGYSETVSACGMGSATCATVRCRTA